MQLSNLGFIEHYAQRYAIEGFHKDAKQNLGLDKSQLHKRQGIVKHLLLVGVAYSLLKIVTWIKKGWDQLSIAQCITCMRELFERETITKAIKKGKRAVYQLFTNLRKS